MIHRFWGEGTTSFDFMVADASDTDGMILDGDRIFRRIRSF